MKKNRNKLIIGSILAFLLYACVTSNTNDELEIYGYKLGDTLTNDFKIIKVQDFPFSRAILKKDKRVEVSLVNKNITTISYKKLNSKEHADLKTKITEVLKSEPEYYEDNTPYNVKIEGEAFYWHDTISGTEVLLGRNPKKDTVLSYLTIYNQKITDSLLNIYTPDFDTINYEIMDIED